MSIIVENNHLKKTLEEKTLKLCLLPSSFIRETKVVEAHLGRINGGNGDDTMSFNYFLGSNLGTLL